ncbi:MAG: sensor domain-containing diguanylate cyclase [Pedobacter sp.]|nr:sensor domain-containing diguanylate cyclase [Pedobacter sp.]
MPIFPEKYRLLGWLSLLLLLGFVSTSLVSYMSSRDYIRKNIAENSLPLTSDNIYSEIQKDILRPVFISSLMAHDTFVRDWLLAGEPDQAAIVRYLAEVKKKYGTVTSFLVSNQSGHYYYADGLLKTVSEDEKRDTWFFRVRQMKEDYETNVDIDMANHDTITIFINHRVQDYDGNFIGATGVGLTLDSMSRLIETYQARFNRVIYFTNTEGRVMLAGKSLSQNRGFLRGIPGLGELEGQILNHDAAPTQLSYESAGGRVLVSSRFIPELGWYLVVEQSETEDMQPVQRVLLLNIAVAVAITALVLLIAWLAVRRYQARLERMAAHDALTGCLNRQAFEIVFQSFVREAQRSRKPLSAILFDIDHFKAINDDAGHLVGDAVLRTLAHLVEGSLRDSDVVARWGGEEFMVLLPDCALEQALALAENLRVRLEHHDFSIGRPVTASLAVAQATAGEDESAFFCRLDDALYRAKTAGRNRVEEALPADSLP